MKRTMLAAMIVFAGPMLAGCVGCCSNNAPKPAPTVQLVLTDPQGNQVYKFYDGGARYYVVPKGEVISEQREGKSTAEDRIPTLKK